MRKLLLMGAICGSATLASAEPAYVTDSLRLSLYAEDDGSGDPIDTLSSGAAVEVLARDTNYAHVRTAGGREGWVKTAFLTNTKPARARLAELEAEITDLKNDVAAAREAQRAAEVQVGKLGHAASTTPPTEALQVALDRLSQENRAYEERFDTYRSTLPLGWVLVALVLTLVGGFAGGLWWLDSLIRRRHGGFRIY
ncbi:MAG: TIGR04211 family SH3 domain-containing protein [Gammaproteobacteria bacterium]